MEKLKLMDWKKLYKEILKYYKMSKNMGIPYSKTDVFKENDIFERGEEEFSSDIKQNRSSPRN